MNGTYAYFDNPIYQDFSYTTLGQVYFITIGLLSMLGNSYLIVLFVKYKNLREILCNWLIVFISIDNVMIGKTGLRHPLYHNLD